MLRQLYPILLSITVALTIGVYMHPGEARKWIQQAGQWGSQVACDALRATVVLADETRSNLSQGGYAYADPAAGSATVPGSAAAYPDPAWAYAADGRFPAAAPGSSQSPQPPSSIYYPANTVPAAGPGLASPAASNQVYYPRVLAGSPAAQGHPYASPPSQPPTPYPGTYPVQTPGVGSPGATNIENPLRPSMPREAPW
ncbi:MAG: hypothetical protein ACYC6Y_23995, partial [Thermoguttaceae bacterium]